MAIAEIYRRFPEKVDCIEYLESARWGGKPICPYCDSDHVTSVPKEHRHHCNKCYSTFSVTVNTVFHHTHLPLQKWFLAISLIFSARKTIASRQLAKALEVNKNTALSLDMRISRAMLQTEQRKLLLSIDRAIDNILQEYKNV